MSILTGIPQEWFDLRDKVIAEGECPQHHIPLVQRMCWICKGETPKEDCRLCKGKGVAIVCPDSNIPYELVDEKWEIVHLEDELV